MSRKTKIFLLIAAHILLGLSFLDALGALASMLCAFAAAGLMLLLIRSFKRNEGTPLTFRNPKVPSHTNIDDDADVDLD